MTRSTRTPVQGAHRAYNILYLPRFVALAFAIVFLLLTLQLLCGVMFLIAGGLFLASAVLRHTYDSHYASGNGGTVLMGLIYVGIGIWVLSL